MANNLVSLAVQPLQLEDPIAQYGRVAQVGNMIQQSREHAQRMELNAERLQQERMQTQEAQRATAEQEMGRQAITQAGGDLPKARAILGTMPGVSRDTLTKFDDEIDKHVSSLAKQEEEKYKNLTTKSALIDDSLRIADAEPDDAKAQQVYTDRQNIHLKNGLIKPEEATPWIDRADLKRQIAASTAVKQTLAMATERRAQAKEKHEEAMRPAQEQKAVSEAAAAASDASQKAKVDVGTSPTGIKAVEQVRLNMEQKRFDKEVNALHETIRNHKATEAETQRFHNLSLDGMQLTDTAKDKMAEMFATTGILPSLGMGKEAGKNRSAIINRSAELYPEVQFATQKASFQANQNSLKNLQKQSDQVDAFEGTAGKNIDVFLKTAGKIIDTGSPLLNSPVRMVSDKLFGSENMAAFKAARETALTEAAKVLESPQGSASLTVAGREAVKTLSDPSATLGMQVASMKILRQDMANRKQSNTEQIDAITKRITAPDRADKPAAEPGKVKTWNPSTNKFE